MPGCQAADFFERFEAVAGGFCAIAPAGDQLGQARQGMRLVFDDEDFFLTSHVRGINPGVTVCCITFEPWRDQERGSPEDLVGMYSEESPIFGRSVHNRRTRLLLHWIPALIGIAIILVESTAMMSSEHTSRWLLPLWIKLFGPVSPERWAVIHHYIRKTGHFVGYGTVSLGFFEAWRVTLEGRWREWRIRFRYAAGLALLCTLLLASWDEWHQSFIPGRTSSVRDVGLDFCGALAAQVALLCVLSVFGRRASVRVATA